MEYRGIFINDEDWGLMPWSSRTYEPSKVKGEIGSRTNERIFELLLRLRANTYWPAMHECTLPFFLTKGNREAAKKYVSSSVLPIANRWPAMLPVSGVGEEKAPMIM